MNIVYCFIGSLPEYSIDTVYQARLFYDGPIYFIVSDETSPLLSKLINEFNVIIIYYKDVISHDFLTIYHNMSSKFMVCNDLKGREKLFIYAFERYFLLYHLMVQKQLSNVLFMEVDNLIYDDPYKWKNDFCKKEIAYMYDNTYRCGAGICFIKNIAILLNLTIFFVNYILNPNNSIVHEMKALHDFWEMNQHHVQLLPIHWPDESLPIMLYDTYDQYQDTLFDVAGMGIYLGGMDPHHTNGIIMKGLRGPWSYIDYTPYQFEWKMDTQQRYIPYIQNPINNKWIKINNLHIHSKALKECVSK